MRFEQFFDTESSTFTYLFADENTGEAALVDPVREHVESSYLPFLKEHSLRLVYVFDTHVHADHVTGAGALRDATDAQTALHELTRADCVDLRLKDRETLRVGELSVEVIHTPGHTPCHVSYRVERELVLTGDSLLIGGCGRTDFQGGDAGALYDSITERLFSLPEETWVYPGHDYRGHTKSTIGDEKRTNPRLAGKTRAEFVSLMANLGLEPPKRIMEAVPANEACGLEPSD